MPFGIFDYHKSLSHLHVGCEAPRAYFVPYACSECAKDGVRDYSPYFKTLCGAWDFKFYKSYHDVPDVRREAVDFVEKLDVPMNWQHAIGRSYDITETEDFVTVKVTLECYEDIGESGELEQRQE